MEEASMLIPLSQKATDVCFYLKKPKFTGMQDSERPVPDEAALWKALNEILGLLGDTFRNTILHDLNSMNRNSPSHGPQHLDLGMISESLKRHFGLDAYEMIMNRVIARAHEAHGRLISTRIVGSTWLDAKSNITSL